MRVWMLAAVVLSATVVISVGCSEREPMGGVVAIHDGKPSAGTATKVTVAAAPAPTAPEAAGEVKLVLKDYDALQALIASKKGKVVVVDVWSTYCDPCMKEFPGLVGLHKKYGLEKVACISMCTNYSGIGKPEDELAEPLKFLQKQGATFDNLLSTDADEALYKKLKIGSVPCIFVYDADGKLAKLFDKETTYAEVEKVVTPLVK
jgi:thiol-disulfide isomerase/thioredoxin